MKKLDLENLLKLEKQGWDCLTKSKGADFYGALMTNNALMILVNGMTLEYRTIVQSLNNAEPWDSYEIKDPRLLNINDNVATLIYSVTAKRGNSEFVALNSSTYSMVNGEIKLNLYQQTTITHQLKNFKTDKIKFENVKFQSMNNEEIPDPNVVYPIAGYHKKSSKLL